MGRFDRHAPAFLFVVILSLTLAGCGTVGSAGSPPATPGGSGTAASPPPTTAAAIPGSFTLTVDPAALSGKSIRGSKVLFLVTVDGSPADGPVTLKVTSEEGLAWADPVSLLPDVVGEAYVWPGTKCPCTTQEAARTVRITASRNGVEQIATRTLTIVDETKQTPIESTDWEHLDAFVTWFAAHRPELRIADSAGWNGMLGSWVPGVEHWVYLSDEWEVNLSWKTGANAPNDWSRIALRHRWSERAPSIAFQIDSVSAKSLPHEIHPPASVWR